MSAKPEVVGRIEAAPHSVDSAMEAAIRYMEEQEVRLKGYKLAIERLEAERLTAELEASVKIAHLKGEKADLAARVEALEKAQDRTAQMVQALVLTPTRDEFDFLKERVEGLCAREVV